MRYEACIRNLSLGQAQALYRLMVNLGDTEPFYGTEGQVWSGLIPGTRDEQTVERTITIQPMVDEKGTK